MAEIELFGRLFILEILGKMVEERTLGGASDCVDLGGNEEFS